MTRRLLLALAAMCMLASCSPKVSTKVQQKYPPFSFEDEVLVFGTNEDVLVDATEIGNVTIRDTGFSTLCSWHMVIDRGKLEARRAGGNILKIIEHKPPDLSSTCHRIKAKILRVEDINAAAAAMEEQRHKVNNDWNYAKFYIYRGKGPGTWVGYDVYLGDSVIWRAKNNSKQELIITKEGLNTIWAKTESKVEVPIDVEFGKEYFIRCSVGMGIMVGRPEIQILSEMQGASEYDAIVEK